MFKLIPSKKPLVVSVITKIECICIAIKRQINMNKKNRILRGFGTSSVAVALRVI